MKINKNTRISTLIKENKNTIEVIGGINKNFLKLKNPVLRKVLAPRVTIVDAAKVGGVALEVLVAKLEEIGFEFESDLAAIPKKTSQKISKELATQFKKMKNVVTLDVRPTIASGADPFKEIMQTVKELKDNETLQIINTFEPIPLIRKLKSKGFDSWTERPEEGMVHTFFRKNIGQWLDNELEEKVEKSKLDFDEQLKHFGKHLRKIDVRQLEMPEPMVKILQEIETLAKGQALFVDHKKIPQFLLPELEARNFEILYKEVDCNHTILLIYKRE
jgi:uncharacterized protein (DUF2249 family)